MRSNDSIILLNLVLVYVSAQYSTDAYIEYHNIDNFPFYVASRCVNVYMVLIAVCPHGIWIPVTAEGLMATATQLGFHEH